MYTYVGHCQDSENNILFKFGHGYQMEDENHGYCTIMCHTTNSRYNNRLNFYSNPRLTGIVNGQKVGVEGR